MKEFRFKVLKEGDSLYSFSDTEMVIKEETGDYRCYKIFDFEIESPQFSKKFELLSTHFDSHFNEKTVVVKKSGKTVVYKIDDFTNKFPVINQNFVIILMKGVGKIEVYDSETRICVKLPAKEEY